MLGRLFSSANSAATSPNGTRPSTAAAIESDELHTRNLLYPSTNSSFHSSLSCSHTSSSSSSGFGDSADIDSGRDVRVIIAQDGSATELKAILYDTHPTPGSTNTQSGFEDGPLLPGGLGSQCFRSRWRPSPSDRLFGGNHHSQGASGSVAPESEMKVLTDCMFGSAPLGYKGPSTKVHILPTVEERKGRLRNSPVSSRRGSVRNIPFGPIPFESEPSTKDGRKEVLITRLFSVVIPSSPTLALNSRDHTPTPASSPGPTNGFPFPRVNGSNPSLGGSAAAKIAKPPMTSMYAVGLIISLPPSNVYNSNSSFNRCYCHQPPFAPFDNDHSHHEFCSSAPPSFGDGHFPHALNLESDAGLDDIPSSLGDDRMDLITKHWDVINRALSDLQRVSQSQILSSLNGAGMTFPQTATQNGYKYRKKIELGRWALMSDECVRKEVERLRWRIVSGIKIPRVATGQGRWGVWRDEAHWANGRFGGREMNFFFLTLLTAFLGHHTEWLDVLGPFPYKRKYHRQLYSTAANEEFAVPARTVILSNDKMASRRLIYLLSAFLPTKSFPSWDTIPPPSRTSSVNCLSQSPPISGTTHSEQVGKKSSLRNKAKRKPSKLSMVTGDAEEVVVGWDIPVATSREPSAAASVLQLPLSSHHARKVGLAAIADPAIPSVNASGSSPRGGDLRPGSSNSAASLSLLGSLKRTGTANTSMDSGSGWGSLFSFWGNSKTGSTAPSESSMRHEEEQGDELYLEDDDLPHHTRHHHKQLSSTPSLPPHNGFHHHHLQFAEGQLKLSVDETDGVVDVDIPIPPMDYPATGYTSPVSSPASSGWAMSVPSLESTGSGYLGSSTSFSSGVTMPNWATDLEDNAVNVAGWMEDERFHPDFALQIVCPYQEIEEEIKRAMRAEATPRHHQHHHHHATTGATPVSESEDAEGDTRWTEVCSVLIADTNKMAIKRLRLKRRSKKSAVAAGLTTPQPLPSALGAHRHLHAPQWYMNPYSGVGGFEDEEEEEMLEEELVCDVDDVLATAVEKVIDFSSTPRGNNKDEMQKLGVQGCRHMVLGALENVVRAVAQEKGGVVENFLTEGVARWLNEIQEVY